MCQDYYWLPCDVSVTVRQVLEDGSVQRQATILSTINNLNQEENKDLYEDIQVTE